MIRKVNGKWRVISERTHRNMGTFDSKTKAKKRLKQIEYFKHTKPFRKPGR